MEHALNESLVNVPLAPCGFDTLPNLKDALDGGRHYNNIGIDLKRFKAN